LPEPPPSLAGRDYLRARDLSAEELGGLLDLGLALKAAQASRMPHPLCTGRTLGMIFHKASTRTRVSFEVGMSQLGGNALHLAQGELQLGRGETVRDTAMVLSRYLDAIMIRTFSQADIDELATWADAPVINGLSDDHHPCQALADLLTLRERFGALEGLVLAYVGAATDVVRSLMEAGGLAGMHVRLACPPDYRPRVEDRVGAEILAERHGGSVSLVADPTEAVAGADAVYTAPWPEPVRSGRAAARMRAYHVDGAVMRLARPNAAFMHCLPAHRGEEVEASVIDGRHAVVWEQVANRLPTEQAVIYALATADRAEAAHEEVA